MATENNKNLNNLMKVHLHILTASCKNNKKYRKFEFKKVS